MPLLTPLFLAPLPMLAKPKIYLDSNATYPLNTAAKAAVFAFLEGEMAGNPSSIHAHGRLAKKWLNRARDQVASSISSSSFRENGSRGTGTIDTEQIVFTSGGSEANQLAIRCALEGRILRGIPTHWLLSSIEHDSNLQMVEWAQTRGVLVEKIPTNLNGRIDLSAFARLLRPETALISVMWVNNETGVIQPIQAIAQLAVHVPLHIDAAQAWGKLTISADQMSFQYLTFSGQKIGGLQGAGFVCLGRGIELHSTILGKQEKGRRGGTESVLPILTMGEAAAALNPALWTSTVQPLRDYLEKKLIETIPEIQVNGREADRVAGTTNITLPSVQSETLVMALDLAGFSVSAGSACSSGVTEPSHVLLAMGRSRIEALASLRVSLNENNTFAELDSFVQTLKTITQRSIGVQNHV